MDLTELLSHLVEALEGAGVRYLLVGAIASAAYGEPRLTRDIDVVADLKPEQLPALAAAFPDLEFHLDLEAAREAIAQCGQFTIIHPASGLNIDVMLCKEDEYDASRFSRARRLELGVGMRASFASPEDVIIKKMDFYRMGGSEKHIRDIGGILRICGDAIDRAYIHEWSDRLGLTEIWEALLKRLK